MRFIKKTVLFSWDNLFSIYYNLKSESQTVDLKCIKRQSDQPLCLRAVFPNNTQPVSASPLSNFVTGIEVYASITDYFHCLASLELY